MLVNDLQIKKLRAVLLGMAVLALAALSAVAMTEAPTFELVNSFGLGVAQAQAVVNAAAAASSFLGFLAALGAGLAGLFTFATFAIIRRIIVQQGFRAAVAY